MKEREKNVLVVLGPTASGKTSLSIQLAQKLDGEIVSADSMQVYRYMDIGTAKPDMTERCGIPHYLMDEVLPDEPFSVARFKELAVKAIEAILGKGKLPIVVGGTGLYIDSLVYNISFSEMKQDEELRKQLQMEAEQSGVEALHKRLTEVDPEAALQIHPNNVKRVIRALEVYIQTGIPISRHQQLSRMQPSPYRFILIGLRLSRETLYRRIDQRVDKMFEMGLVDEVKELQARGYAENPVAMQGLGYKEILSFLRGELTLDEARYIISRDTRHYAKRQETWFKRMKDIYWLDWSDDVKPTAMENLRNHLATFGIFL